MAILTIDDAILNNIADAIRSKNGTTDTYKPREMGPAILTIPIPDDDESGKIDYVITGDCRSKFSDGKADLLFTDSQLRDGINYITSNITDSAFMFSGNEDIKEIPFELNYDINGIITLTGMFQGCYSLESIPVFNNCKFRRESGTAQGGFSSMFNGCLKLKSVPDNFINMFDTTNVGTCDRSSMFSACRSLRSIPVNIFEKMGSGINFSQNYYTNAFNGCYSLDELVDILAPCIISGTVYSDKPGHYKIGSNCCRLKRLKFKTIDGCEKFVEQTLDLSTFGYDNDTALTFHDENAEELGLVKVIDENTYNQYKNTNDWYTGLVEYSRYNKTSAVETIGSLPNTSYWVETYDMANNIIFKGEAGSATDGGAINTMTAAQIAVATAKGWTVAFV